MKAPQIIFGQFHSFLSRILPMLAMAAAALPALAQEPPGRVARLNHVEGPVVFSPLGDNEWTDAVLNRPLTRGDRLWADRGSRAELQVGSGALRMDGGTLIGLTAVDDEATQISLTQGSVQARIRELLEAENFELDTPNLAFRAVQAGHYRIDVDQGRGTTRVTVHSGKGLVYGESGQVLALVAGQQAVFRGRGLVPVAEQASASADAFDRWALERERKDELSVSARYLSRNVTGYQQLDAHGDWASDPALGPVWFPRVAGQNWAPYRHGRWDWVAPWGWTWIDDAPWGFAPSHYGRWAQIGSKWAWVPGRLPTRPLYAPALVAFVNSGNGGVDWSVQAAAGRPAAAWFPLAPGEAWRPGYQASAGYIRKLNQPIPVVDPQGGIYAHQRRAGALTAAAGDDRPRAKAQPHRAPASPVAAPVVRPQIAAVAPSAPVRQVAAAPANPQPARPVAIAPPAPRVAAAPTVAVPAARSGQVQREQPRPDAQPRRMAATGNAQAHRGEGQAQARRAPLLEQRSVAVRRDESMRRGDREDLRQEAWQREQQAMSEQWRREHLDMQQRIERQHQANVERHQRQQQQMGAEGRAQEVARRPRLAPLGGPVTQDQGIAILRQR